MNTRIIPSDPFTRNLVRIGELIVQGKLPDAAKALNLLQRKNAQDPRVFLLGMKLARAANNPTAELQAGQRAVSLTPDWPVAVMELAHAYSRQGRHVEAMQQARRARQVAPDEIDVLLHAIEVAQKAEDFEQAIGWTQLALQQVPPAQAQELRYARAYYLQRALRPAEAMPLFAELMQEFPASAPARIGHMTCARELGLNDVVRQDADALMALDPNHPEHQYAHALAYGITPMTQPESTVIKLFDAYAKTYDMELVRKLQYRVPEMVAQRLLALHPDRRFNVLDLGCGTGLLAVFLGPIRGAMIGVDLSGEMLNQAERTGLYARLHQVNLLDAVRETPSDHYEAIVCNDVLIYVGDLQDVIPNALRILKAGGHFIFSCETAAEDGPDYVLNTSSNRYAHKASYVERLCQEAGFVNIELQHLEKLRLDNGVPLPGYLVCAEKPVPGASGSASR